MSESAPECPHCGIKNYALQEKNSSPEAALKLMSNPIQVVVAVVARVFFLSAWGVAFLLLAVLLLLVLIKLIG